MYPQNKCGKRIATLLMLDLQIRKNFILPVPDLGAGPYLIVMHQILREKEVTGGVTCFVL